MIRDHEKMSKQMMEKISRLELEKVDISTYPIAIGTWILSSSQFVTYFELSAEAVKWTVPRSTEWTSEDEVLSRKLWEIHGCMFLFKLLSNVNYQVYNLLYLL